MLLCQVHHPGKCLREINFGGLRVLSVVTAKLWLEVIGWWHAFKIFGAWEKLPGVTIAGLVYELLEVRS